MEISKAADESSGAGAFEAEVSMHEGRRSSYEVTVNGKTAYSKLESGAFPADYATLAKEVADYAASGAAPAHWR